MRKLGILVMALVLVVGMSSGVMADTATNLSSSNASGELEVDLTVPEFGHVGFDSTDALELTTTSNPSPESYTGTAEAEVGIEITANTDVQVRVRESVSKAVADQIGDEYVEATNSNITYPATSNNFKEDDVAVGFAAWLEKGSSGGELGRDNREKWNKGAQRTYTINTSDESFGPSDNLENSAGNTVEFDGTLHLDMSWYGNQWQELKATTDNEDLYSGGEVIVIVEAY